MGRHTVAPSSMRAWLKAPGASRGMTWARAAVMRFFTAGAVICPSVPVMRVTTRQHVPVHRGHRQAKGDGGHGPPV